MALVCKSEWWGLGKPHSEKGQRSLPRILEAPPQKSNVFVAIATRVNEELLCTVCLKLLSTTSGAALSLSRLETVDYGSTVSRNLYRMTNTNLFDSIFSGALAKSDVGAMATRERLIRAGLDLFHRHGIHPVALDRILQHAGVTKTTFYNYFESKEDFACAVIDRFGEEVHKRIQVRVDTPQATDVKQHLLNIFDAWDELFDHEAFRGCMLVGAGVASGDQHDPARQAAIKNKQRLLHIYEDLAIEAGITNPHQFATRFGLLVDGALVARHLYGDRNEAEEAHKMAEQLIDEALQNSAS